MLLPAPAVQPSHFDLLCWHAVFTYVCPLLPVLLPKLIFLIPVITCLQLFILVLRIQKGY